MSREKEHVLTLFLIDIRSVNCHHVGMESADLTLLLSPALRPKDFREVELSKQQLRMWSDLTGFQPCGREDGKWRLFSPADVFRLMAMRNLKGRTGLAISDHPSLVRVLGADEFFLKAVRLWVAARLPCFVTDFDSNHGLIPADEIDALALVRAGVVHCLLDLAPALRLMRLAVVRGGTDEQRLLCHQLEVAREMASEAPAGVPDAPKAASRSKGKGRLLQLDEGDFPLSLRRDEVR